mmetsp:Transcript_58609/g.164413  ORF Transcript_58609/g.164413 Transcript_58609/m.164413 type:complete len:120 (-) Transcript_58609:1426-1785(-)
MNRKTRRMTKTILCSPPLLKTRRTSTRKRRITDQRKNECPLPKGEHQSERVRLPGEEARAAVGRRKTSRTISTDQDVCPAALRNPLVGELLLPDVVTGDGWCLMDEIQAHQLLQKGLRP